MLSEFLYGNVLDKVMTFELPVIYEWLLCYFIGILFIPSFILDIVLCPIELIIWFIRKR